MNRFLRSLTALLTFTMLAVIAAAAPLKVLILDGQNNHEWHVSTPQFKQALEETGLFQVDVATSPPKGGDMSTFRPQFSNYSVVVSNYHGDAWSSETKTAFVDYMRAGGGFVPIHAADNAFPDWKEYNEICGLGGWEGRNEKSGPWVYWDGKIIRDTSPGRGGDHGAIRPFLITARESDHPIMRGLPAEWMHASDELYDRLRGPAENLTVLATAYADPATRGSGRHEPVLMALTYGKGRVFHMPLGHVRGDTTAIRCAGFITLLQRGTEWAATGNVTQKTPDDFPSAIKISVR